MAEKFKNQSVALNKVKFRFTQINIDHLIHLNQIKLGVIFLVFIPEAM